MIGGRGFTTAVADVIFNKVRISCSLLVYCRCRACCFTLRKAIQMGYCMHAVRMYGRDHRLQTYRPPPPSRTMENHAPKTLFTLHVPPIKHSKPSKLDPIPQQQSLSLPPSPHSPPQVKTKGERRISFDQFMQGLLLASMERQEDVEYMVMRVMDLEGPTVTGTVPEQVRESYKKIFE